MKRFILTILFLLVSTVAFAQQNGTKFAFDVNYSVTVANTYTYKLYLDTGATGTPIAGVTCATVTATTSLCTFFLPSNTPTGAHDLLVSLVTSQGVESNKSTAFRIDVPTVPTNLRLQ